MNNTILISGANRGLGLEFVKQYAHEGELVLACCRNPTEATQLLELKKQYSKIEIYPLDLASIDSIKSLARDLSRPIDIIINNAGMLEKDQLGDLSVESLMRSFQINAIAPIKMAEAFMKHLENGKRKLLACVSSSMGSIGSNTSGGYYSYRTSKAALNMLMKSAAVDLMPNGIKVLLLHPGWVKTQMGGTDANISPEVSITGMRTVIENYNPPAGEVIFYRYSGEIVPW